MIRITKAGWIYIFLTLFLGFSAINTGNNLVFLVVSALLGFMGVSGFFGKANLSRITVYVEVPAEVYAGKSSLLKIRLRNDRKFFPAFLLTIRMRGSALLFPYIATKSEAAGSLRFFFDSRGIHTFQSVELCSVFPFNFFIRSTTIETNLTVVAFPEPRRCEMVRLFEKDVLRGDEQSSDTRGYDSEVQTIRDYIQGDPLKYISWKATAKTGDLKTKEMSTLLCRPTIIDFEAVQVKNVEEKLSCVTYAILQLLSRNSPVGLKISGKLFKPGLSRQHKITLLKVLALYGTPETS